MAELGNVDVVHEQTILKKSFLRLIWHETTKTHNQPFFFAGEKVPCFRSSSFFGFGRE